MRSIDSNPFARKAPSADWNERQEQRLPCSIWGTTGGKGIGSLWLPSVRKAEAEVALLLRNLGYRGGAAILDGA